MNLLQLQAFYFKSSPLFSFLIRTARMVLCFENSIGSDPCVPVWSEMSSALRSSFRDFVPRTKFVLDQKVNWFPRHMNKGISLSERFLKIICFSFRYSRNRQKVEASKLHPRSSRCSNSFQWSQLEFNKSTFVSQTYHIDTEQSRFVGKCLQKTNQRKIAQWNGFEPCQYKRYNLFEFCEF